MINLKKIIDFIPDSENIFFHAGISSLKKFNNYKTITLKLLGILEKKNLKSLIVPTYTYSFTKEKIFNRKMSPSEVGRFSEEVRKICKIHQRSIDPIFSCVDVFNSGIVNDYLHTASFEKNSIFEYWNNINGILVNFGLNEIVSTQLHYIEFKNNVSYRKNKLFKGHIIDQNKKMKIEYNFFFIKNINKNFFEKSKILKDLISENLINQRNISNINIMWFRSRDVFNFLSKKIQNDKNYLLIAK